MSRTRPVSVDDVVKQWQAAGQALHPFRSFEELASVIEAMAVFPVGTPKRAQRVCDWLGKRSDVGAFTMDAALKRLDVSASVIIEQLPPSAGNVLVTDRETCVVTKCGGNLVQSRDQLRAQPRGVSRPTIYTDRGVLSGELFWKRCERCDARHYLSYAVSGYHIPSGQLLPYPGWESAEWTHVTEHEVWQTTLLKRYRQQLLHSHTAADAYMREYAGLHETQLPVAQRKHLSHLWLSWELVAWLQELGEAATPIEIGSIAGLDAALLRLTPRLLDLFTRFWGVGHKQLCPQGAETCVCYIMDGHMKCRRLVCANKHARLVDQGTLGTAVLGCTHTPLLGSIWCAGCRDAGAVRGAAGTIRAAIDLPPPPPTETAEEAAARAEAAQLEAAQSEAARKRDVYLVEDVLDAEPQTVVRGGEEHRECMRKRLLRMKIRWVGYPPSEDSWVCQCNVGKAAVAGWKAKQAAAKEGRHMQRAEKHAGQLAAEAAAATPSGDLNISAEERATFDPVCNNIKDQHVTGKTQSAGVLALVASCGLILAAGEIYGSESLTQVHLFLHTLFFSYRLPPPDVLVYDDACHLAMYLLNRLGRFGKSILAVWLVKVVKVALCVDRFHWRNHTGAFCKRNVNPKKCRALGPRSNTEAAEITFSWLARMKHIFKGMNEARFMFTMLRLFHLRNKFLLKRAAEKAARERTLNPSWLRAGRSCEEACAEACHGACEAAAGSGSAAAADQVCEAACGMCE